MATGKASTSSDTDAAATAYLKALGDRVRKIRAQRGMTRRILARDSQVSERYLAQLESGHGNVSILLLRQIAAAMGVPLADLVHDGPERAVEFALAQQLLAGLAPKDMAEAYQLLAQQFGRDGGEERAGRIALIGLRGAGKSTLGRIAAERLACRSSSWSARSRARPARRSARSSALRPGRPIAATSAARWSASSPSHAARDHRHRRQLVSRAVDLRDPAALLPHGVGQGEPARAHGPRRRPGRHAADEGQPGGDGGPPADPRRPRRALRKADAVVDTVGQAARPTAPRPWSALPGPCSAAPRQHRSA